MKAICYCILIQSNVLLAVGCFRQGSLSRLCKCTGLSLGSSYRIYSNDEMMSSWASFVLILYLWIFHAASLDFNSGPLANCRISRVDRLCGRASAFALSRPVLSMWDPSFDCRAGSSRLSPTVASPSGDFMPCYSVFSLPKVLYWRLSQALPDCLV